MRPGPGPTTSSGGTQDSDYIEFTYGLLDEYKLAVADAMKLQFFNSNQILMGRTVTGGSSQVAQGKLITRSGVTIDEVEVSKMTPGVARSITPEQIEIGFGGKSTFFFVSTDPADPYWLGNADPNEECSSTAQYGGQTLTRRCSAATRIW